MVYQFNLNNGFTGQNATPGTVVLSPDQDFGTGTFTGSLVCPTDEASKQVLDQFLATVDRGWLNFPPTRRMMKADDGDLGIPNSDPDDLPNFLNIKQATPVANPAGTSVGLGSIAGLESSGTVFTDAYDLSRHDFDLDSCVGILFVEDAQPTSPQPCAVHCQPSNSDAQMP